MRFFGEAGTTDLSPVFADFESKQPDPKQLAACHADSDCHLGGFICVNLRSHQNWIMYCMMSEDRSSKKRTA